MILVASSSGCRTSELRITLPHGFRGEVFLACETESSDSTSATVDAGDSATLVTCPTKRSRIDAIQDGHTKLVDDVQWNRTGDGILTGIRFLVHQINAVSAQTS